MYEYSANIVRIVDGDTLEAVIDLGFHASVKEKFRLAHVNTPEMSTLEGKTAKQFVETELLNKTVRLKCLGQDKYGRWLAEIIYNSSLLIHEEIIKKSLGVPYEGGKR